MKRPAPAAPSDKRADYGLVLNRVILHRQALRRQLASETGFSAGTISKHTQWLSQNGFLQRTSRAIPGAKKPVDILEIDENAGTFLAIEISKDRLAAELMTAGIHPLHRCEEACGETQREILAMLAKIVVQMREIATKHRRTIDFVGMSLRGQVDDAGGIVYTVPGVPGWEPCQPAVILPDFKGIPAVGYWTQTACKAKGVCDETKKDEGVGYIEYNHGRLSVASVKAGKLQLGSHGTTSALVHIQVAKRGPVCFCGRTGCFSRLLQEGGITADQIGAGLCAIAAALPKGKIVVEWRETGEPLQSPRKTKLARTQWVDNGTAYASAGLRLLCAEKMLDRLVEKAIRNENEARK